MRILIISTFFPPLNSIASLRPYSWAKYWTLAGHDVTVLTIGKDPDVPKPLDLPNPGYTVIEVDQPFIFKKLRGIYSQRQSPAGGPSQPKGNDFSRLLFGLFARSCAAVFDWLRYKKGLFNACRMPDFTDLWIRPALEAMEQKGCWDFIISTAGPYSVHLVAHALKRRGKTKKWVADYRDTWSDGFIYPGLFPFNFIENRLEKRILKNADLITTVSLPFASHYAQRYPDKKILTFENGFDPEDLDHLSGGAVFPADGKFRIVHTGSIYVGKRDPSPLFAAVENISQSTTHRQLLNRLEIIFAGPRQESLQGLIKKFQVGQWVKFPGFVSREEALKMQRDAHWLLFLPWNDASVDGILTGKIFEYLFSRTPIMAVGGNGMEASQKLILEADAGIVLASADEIGNFLIDKLTSLAKEKTCIAPEIFNRYNRKVLAEKLLSAAGHSHLR